MCSLSRTKTPSYCPDLVGQGWVAGQPHRQTDRQTQVDLSLSLSDMSNVPVFCLSLLGRSRIPSICHCEYIILPSIHPHTPGTDPTVCLCRLVCVTMCEQLCRQREIGFRYYDLKPHPSPDGTSLLWAIDQDSLARAVEDDSSGTARAILVNNPANPTGSVFSRTQLQHVIGVAERYDLPIVGDEIYANMVGHRSTHCSTS